MLLAILVQNWSNMVQNWSGMVPEAPETLLGHFWDKSFFSNHETSTCPKTDLFQNTCGHESPNMASKNNVLQQKSPPRAKLFGAGVILP